MDPPSTKSWSIHTRREITSKYQILERIGSGAYSDVYKGVRRSDSLTVALKEIHDYQSALREIEALKSLQNSPNVVVLYECFWSEDEDAVLVLEYLPVDLGDVIRAASKWENGLSVGEIKRWMVQILSGVDTCHRNNIVHRDLKPSNLLVSADGVLKLADFGQARILLALGLVAGGEDSMACEEYTLNHTTVVENSEILTVSDSHQQKYQMVQEQGDPTLDEYGRQSHEHRATYSMDETDIESNIYDGDASCLATCTTSDIEEDPLKNSSSYEAEGGNDGIGSLTSCVGTRWFRAPELLYGSTSYRAEIDLWSLGCIFAELLSLAPLFPGTSDIDQLSRIFNVLGNLSEEVWPGCVELPDYNLITFGKVEKPIGLEACLPNRSPDEIDLVKRLLCFDPASRAAAMELLHHRYLNEDPLAIPVSELRVPTKHIAQDEDSSDEGVDYRDLNSDSDFEEFGPMSFTKTDDGFSIRFP